MPETSWLPVARWAPHCTCSLSRTRARRECVCDCAAVRPVSQTLREGPRNICSEIMLCSFTCLECRVFQCPTPNTWQKNMFRFRVLARHLQSLMSRTICLDPQLWKSGHGITSQYFYICVTAPPLYETYNRPDPIHPYWRTHIITAQVIPNQRNWVSWHSKWHFSDKQNLQDPEIWSG